MLGDILQPTHLILVLLVALLFLGPKRLPSAGRALGQGLREFRSSITGERADDADPEGIAGRPEAPWKSPDDKPAPANAQG
jgi:sec-independent protein translocase protein TatA